MTSFYNLSKADPAIADSGGVQFVGQRGHLLGQGSLSQLAAVIGTQSLVIRGKENSCVAFPDFPFRHNKKQRLATQALFRQQMMLIVP
ncbi:hypothetical protein L484_027941 [Morus notabilis]|uniref:Uncharacterized protein n=1 Tax=Morus notabilis TaxID=981085 RepID=W9S7M6_9ROSA|nr:hypothetical protein L484_027941 [Morus notabilis]